jgi:hypothetical protein
VKVSTRKRIGDTIAFGDADTADLFTEVSRGIDYQLWLVESHMNPEYKRLILLYWPRPHRKMWPRHNVALHPACMDDKDQRGLLGRKEGRRRQSYIPMRTFSPWRDRRCICEIFRARWASDGYGFSNQVEGRRTRDMRSQTDV